MNILNVVKANKKRFIAAFIVAVMLFGGAVMVYAMSMDSSNKKNSEMPSYKEEIVKRQNITMGTSELGSATMPSIAIKAIPDINVNDSSTSNTSSQSNQIKLKVEEVYVKSGQRIKTGDPIVKVDMQSLNSQIAKVEDSYAAAQVKYQEAILKQKTGAIDAKYTLKENGLLNENAQLIYDAAVSDIIYQLSAADESYSKLGDDYNQCKEDITNYKSIINSGSATSEQKTQAQTDLEKAEDRLDSLKSQLSTAANKLNSLESKQALSVMNAENEMQQNLSKAENAHQLYDLTVKSLQTNVDSALANLNELKSQMALLKSYKSDGVIKSTKDGLIISVGVQVGSEVTSSTALVNIASGEIFVNVSITQDNIASIEFGQETSVVFDAYPKQTYKGLVDSISYEPVRSTSSTVSYNVSIAIQDNPKDIFEGMSGNVTFISKQVQDVLCVSSRAVIKEGSENFVNVKNKDGTIVKTKVETGLSNGKQTEIKYGLQEGQTVIIESAVKR